MQDDSQRREEKRSKEGGWRRIERSDKLIFYGVEDVMLHNFLASRTSSSSSASDFWSNSMMEGRKSGTRVANVPERGEGRDRLKGGGERDKIKCY